MAARVCMGEAALRKLHELEFDVGRVVSGFGSCPLPPVAETNPEAIGRTNDAVLYGGQVELHRRRPRRGARGDRSAPAGLGLERLRRAVRQGARGAPTGTSTRSTRCSSVRPRCASRAYRAGAAFTPGAWTSTSSSGPSGDERAAARGPRSSRRSPPPSTRTERSTAPRWAWNGETRRSSSSPTARRVRYATCGATGAAVVNLTDEILLFFTQAALGDPQPPTRPTATIDGAVLADACSWREVTVAAIDANGPRAPGHHPRRGSWNRARVPRLQPGPSRGAEASIIAWRARWLPSGEIRAELERLQVLVDKTAGPQEREAMELVRRHVRAAVGSG